MNKAFIAFLLAVGIIAGAGIGWLSRGVFGGDKADNVQAFAKVDSIVTLDTSSTAFPKEVLSRRAVKDSVILVPVYDTIRVKDTIFTPVEREEKVYEDSTFRAVVSGYSPRLDSINVYNKTIVVTRTQQNRSLTRKAHRLGLSFGAQGGVGYVRTFNGQPGMGVYAGVGLGLTYTF